MKSGAKNGAQSSASATAIAAKAASAKAGAAKAGAAKAGAATSGTRPMPLGASPLSDFSFRDVPRHYLIGGGILALAFLWSYWPTLIELLHIWGKEPDYSHGYLVAPVALYALWSRRDTMPKLAQTWCWGGLALLGVCFLVRYLGAAWYVSSVDGWSIMLWVAGACWLLAGWPFCRWALPGVAFLVFMVPLPWKVEHALRDPLQKVATKGSAAILRCLGQPALSQANTIHMGAHELNVDDACAGLRIFVTIIVLACAYIMIVRPPWWERVMLIVAIVPIALVTNAMRIVITGLLYQFVSSDAGKKFSHDFAGILMIPIAALMFGLLLWYMSRLIREVDSESVYGRSMA